jgi:hypothetical protein
MTDGHPHGHDGPLQLPTALRALRDTMSKVPPFSPEERETIVRAAMKHNRLSRTDAELMFDKIGERQAKRNPLLEKQWTSLLHRMSEALRNGSAEPRGIFHSVFWIRLHGALTEIPRRFALFDGLPEQMSPGSPGHRWANAGAEVSRHAKRSEVPFPTTS